MSKAMNELVRKYFTGASDTMCEFILWERIKSYPLGSMEQIEHELSDYAMNFYQGKHKEMEMHGRREKENL